MVVLILSIMLWSMVGGGIYIYYIFKMDKQAPIWLITICGPSIWIASAILQKTVFNEGD